MTIKGFPKTTKEILRELEIKNLFQFSVNYDYFKLSDEQHEKLQNKIKEVLKQKK